MGVIDVAAYVWPAYTGDEPRTRIFWPEGYGEWQTVKKAYPKYEGHAWPRRPLWGYQNEADPRVMQMQIDAAVAYGVNVFVYDWYWYDNRPFLEHCLNNGFLQAENRNKMKFYLMWANHDARHLWDTRNSATVDETIWSGKVSRAVFEKIAVRWIEKYFSQENYYKIDGKPVISIYDIDNFIEGLGGLREAGNALQWFRRQVESSGFPGVHVQCIIYNEDAPCMRKYFPDTPKPTAALCSYFAFDSVTHYHMLGSVVEPVQTYDALLQVVEKDWYRKREEYAMPFVPSIALGWDDNPRFSTLRLPVITGNSPQAVENAFRKAKAYVQSGKQPQLMLINSWNEWTEGGYLEPDDLNGYGYLQALKNAVCDR